MKKSYLSKIFIGVIVIVSGATVARAQAPFSPGYVVPLAGDTLRGQVQELGELRNAQVCRFRPTATAASTDYAPTALRAYGLAGGARYEARPVPPADSTRATPAPLFVEVLVSGPARLYTCRDRPGHTRYFVAVGGPKARLRELAERRVKTFSNSFEAYETLSLYRDTLAAALRACPAAQVLLPRLPFQPAALGRVITRYNECVGGPAAVSARLAPRAQGPVLSLLGGYQYGTLTLNGANIFFNVAPPLHQGVPVGGLALSFTMPHTRQTITLRLEAQYAHEVYEGEHTGPVPTAALPTPQLNKYKFDLTYLHVPVLLRYTLMRSPGLRPFLEAGIVYARLFQATTAFSGQQGTAAQIVFPFFQGEDVQYNQFGFAAGVGVSAPVLAERRLALLARVSTANGPSNYVQVGAPITYFSALLSLDLTKP